MKHHWMSNVMLLCALSVCCLNATAETPTIPTQQPGMTNSSQDPEMAQFQEWLKNNTHQPGVPTAVSALPPTAADNTANTATAPPPATPGKPVIYYPQKRPPLTFNESRTAMLNAAPPSPPSSEEATTAFNAMMQQNMPLTPEQIVKLHQLIDTSQRAAAIPANVPPKPVSTTLMINLAPGATPPAVRLAQGYVTSLVFVDSAGAPWPIASFDIGEPKANNLQWDGKSNVLLIQAVAPYGDTDLVIRLVGLPTPLTLELVSGQRIVDYRVDLHVSGIGPNTKDLPTGTPLPSNANQLLLGILDGVAPPGSKQLVVKGGDCQAWLLGEKMYLRTRLTLLSPGWVGRMVSPDGTQAYEVQKSSSVLVSQYGNPSELRLEGF